MPQMHKPPEKTALNQDMPALKKMGGDKPRVLFIDDEEPQRRIINIIFGKEWDITFAVDGKEGVEKYDAQGPFDVVFTDRNMPEMLGGDVVRHIKAKNQGQYVVMMSGDLTPAEQATIPADQFIDKPYSIKILGDIVRERKMLTN